MPSAWPARPKPVTSVAACARASTIARDASRLSAVMTGAASANRAADSWPARTPLISRPVPSGLVSTSASPARAPALRTTSRG